MRLGIKAKQVAGVTLLVGIAVLLLSAWYLSELARVRLQETNARAEFVAQTIFDRVFDAIATGSDPQGALQMAPGLQSILTASLKAGNIQYTSIVDLNGRIVADGNPASIGTAAREAQDLRTLLAEDRVTQMRVIANRDSPMYEIPLKLSLQRPDSLGTQEDLATIRVGVSTLLVRAQLEESLRTPVLAALIALLAATVMAVVLAQIVLRPIHVIRSGLARLGRGELDVKVDLPQERELAELGDSFKAVSARLAADQSELAGQKATLESIVEHLEDAVALFAPDGTLLFANPSMRATFGTSESNRLDELLPDAHPYRTALEETIATRRAQGPRRVSVPGAGDRLILTHIVGPSTSPGPGEEAAEPMGVMLVTRNLAYLSEVESTISYSRKLAALGRLSAGIAHEVKNPLNATMIHLELLKMQVQDTPATEHLTVIAAQVRRLDEVVQGFLKFTRPADPDLRPTALDTLVRDLLPIINAEAGKSGVEVRVDVPASLPDVSADAGMLQQAFLNLALNACQAMPHGGRLRIAAVARPDRRVEVTFEDTGHGIAPEHLEKIFDLYFTTKDRGTGIGLSMVYRTVQLHDGDIEVQSVAGTGTTFRVTLRQA